LAGGGVHGGAIYGRSDKHAAHPEESPVAPLDYAATIYHALGIAPETIVKNRIDRPNRVCEGTPIHALFA
jgi:hypothetical protein